MHLQFGNIVQKDSRNSSMLTSLTSPISTSPLTESLALLLRPFSGVFVSASISSSAPIRPFASYRLSVGLVAILEKNSTELDTEEVSSLSVMFPNTVPTHGVLVTFKFTAFSCKLPLFLTWQLFFSILFTYLFWMTTRKCLVDVFCDFKPFWLILLCFYKAWLIKVYVNASAFLVFYQ